MPVDLQSVLSNLLTSATVANAFGTPLDAATHYITNHYNALGGASGLLGSTDGEISPCPDGIGFFRHFWNNGSIYWSPASGVHAVQGAIREKWASLGWERSFLGYPVTDEIPGANPQTTGSFQFFQGGGIYTYSQIRIEIDSVLNAVEPLSVSARPAMLAPALTIAERTTVQRTIAERTTVQRTTGQRTLGLAASRLSASELSAEGNASFHLAVRPPKPSIGTTHEVHGAILGKYEELGAEASFLGYPTTDESGTPDGVGRFNHFQAGSIYWTPSTGAHEVHGLIREFWAAHGWERNVALGYPISDELIPDRRIGHVRPETQRKHVFNLPVDVVKLPVEAVNAGGIPRGALNVMTKAKTLAATEMMNPQLGVLGGLLLAQPASTAAPDRSVNRFGDFENGVVFWSRGAAAAVALSPWTKAADGTVIQKTVADVLGATLGHLGAALQLPGGTTIPAPAGTTAHAWDGAGVEGRRHQIQVNVLVMEGGPVPLPRMHSVMLYVLVMLEPERRTMTGFLVDYATGEGAFAAKLDPLLWSPFDILTFPDTNDGEAYSILSVKTMPNGDVNTYIEPKQFRNIAGGLAGLETTLIGRIG